MSKPQVILKEEYQEELNDLYNTCLEIGHTKEEAQKFYFKRLQYLNELEELGDPYEKVHLLKKYELSKLDGYEKLSEGNQKKLLKSLGLNIKKPIWENVFIVRDGCNLRAAIFLCGEERTDKEWINMRVDGQISFFSSIRNGGSDDHDRHDACTCACGSQADDAQHVDDGPVAHA